MATGCNGATGNVTRPTAVLIPGNMCDARLWSGDSAVIAAALTAWGIAVAHADTSQDATITAMAARALAANEGMLMPVGFSMGGNVAIEMARLSPERLAGLVLIDCNAGADLPERAALRPSQQARVRAGELADIVAKELKPMYLAAVNRVEADTPLKQLLLDMAIGLGPEVFCRQSEALRTRSDGRGVLAAVTRPVLVMAGAEDALCPPAWHEATAATVVDATLVMVPGAGHMLPLEQSRALAAALGGWIDTSQGRLSR